MAGIPEKHTLDHERLFKLRLAVARHGEMDVASWWNTKGMLGRYGAMALARGLPRTHCFAQARVVFAVAANRCRELFDPPDSMTFWDLSPEIEEQFEDRRQHWLDQSDEWAPFFRSVSDYKGGDLLGFLRELGLVTPSQAKFLRSLPPPGDGVSVALPADPESLEELPALLAAGFSLGRPGRPVIPYVRAKSG